MDSKRAFTSSENGKQNADHYQFHTVSHSLNSHSAHCQTYSSRSRITSLFLAILTAS